MIRHKELPPFIQVIYLKIGYIMGKWIIFFKDNYKGSFESTANTGNSFKNMINKFLHTSGVSFAIDVKSIDTI